MGPSKRRNSPNDDGNDARRRRALRGGNGFMSKLSTVVGNVCRRRENERYDEDDVSTIEVYAKVHVESTEDLVRFLAGPRIYQQ